MTKMNQAISNKNITRRGESITKKKKRGKILEKLERSYIRFDSTLYFTIEPKKKREEEKSTLFHI